jgi:hypothetical protein
MARYEFKFVVSDVEISTEHQKKVSQAVAQAGALALAEAMPPHAVSVEYLLNHWWCGIPAVEVLEQLQEDAAQKAGERALAGEIG